MLCRNNEFELFNDTILYLASELKMASEVKFKEPLFLLSIKTETFKCNEILHFDESV